MGEKRKYLIIVGDGMSDLPLEKLSGKTPLEFAATPHMDYLAQRGVVGIAKTVPDGMVPGSDVANLSIFGYNPLRYFTGRAPLEAISMGIELTPRDAAFRCNLVTINNGIMEDFSADHIDSSLTKIVIEEISQSIAEPGIELYPGVSYRNLLVWRNYPYQNITRTTPPHDIQEHYIGKYYPEGDGAELLKRITERSWEIIHESTVIRDAKKQIKGNPTSVWLWGGGKKPVMESLQTRYGLEGYTISAVDLMHGIGLAIGLKPKYVEGATGYLDTNYEGKAMAAMAALDDSDFVFLHIEAPDESGHEGDIDHKLQAIEDFDARIVGPMLEHLKKYDDYTVLIMPDHATPVSLRTHIADPVPFCMYRNVALPKPRSMTCLARAYTESEAQKTGLYIDDASTLVDIMVKGKFPE